MDTHNLVKATVTITHHFKRIISASIISVSIAVTGGMALEAVVPMSANAQRRGNISGFKTDKCTLSLDRVRGIFDFVKPCIAHDRCYFNARRNGQGNRQGFRACDRRFLRNLRRACNRQHRRLSPQRVACYDMAVRYYGAVRSLTETGTRRAKP
jgi:Prokaryotic phospholipase A2